MPGGASSGALPPRVAVAPGGARGARAPYIVARASRRLREYLPGFWGVWGVDFRAAPLEKPPLWPPPSFPKIWISGPKPGKWTYLEVPTGEFRLSESEIVFVERFVCSETMEMRYLTLGQLIFGGGNTKIAKYSGFRNIPGFARFLPADPNLGPRTQQSVAS